MLKFENENFKYLFGCLTFKISFWDINFISLCFIF